MSRNDHSPAKVVPYFELNQRAAQDRRDSDGELDDTTCTRLLFPCSDSPGSSELGRNFHPRFSESEQDLEAVAPV